MNPRNFASNLVGQVGEETRVPFPLASFCALWYTVPKLFIGSCEEPAALAYPKGLLHRKSPVPLPSRNVGADGVGPRPRLDVYTTGECVW